MSDDITKQIEEASKPLKPAFKEIVDSLAETNKEVALTAANFRSSNKNTFQGALAANKIRDSLSQVAEGLKTGEGQLGSIDFAEFKKVNDELNSLEEARAKRLATAEKSTNVLGKLDKELSKLKEKEKSCLMNLRDKNLKKLKKNHVYSEKMEHDACGVGLVASTEGKKSRKVVEYGIQALKAVWHRGAVDADGKTGDGAGIHIEIPSDFFVEKIEVTGHKHNSDDEVCVGMIFLPRNDYSAQERCRTIVESELTKNNFYIYGWRQVPVDSKVLGEKAELTRPEIAQVLFKTNDKEIRGKNLERKLYETRRKIEKSCRQKHLNNFYICSFSSKSIIYKGMFLAEALSDFYLDLKDERFISRYAIFHQRFSTNTAPSWDLAQPFRSIAHNGEINTLKGNVNWMKVHEEEMFDSNYDNMENLKPVIPEGNSDSASLDNVFELLSMSGHSAPLTKLMLIPDAWSKKSKILPKNQLKLFNFLNSTMEPWDGPAALAGTDNEWVIAASDRNGLRPLRFTITRDKLLFAGSETGMVDLNEKKIIRKGRLGPGEIIGVRIEKGKVFTNSQIKDYLAKEYKHFNNQIIDLDKKFPIEKENNNYEGSELRKRQHTFGYSLEDLELILHPMAEDAKEATGSMGDDTPLAVLSDKYRPLYHYFRQNFSQVTNPPIDSLRAVSYTHLTLPTKA